MAPGRPGPLGPEFESDWWQRWAGVGDPGIQVSPSLWVARLHRAGSELWSAGRGSCLAVWGWAQGPQQLTLLSGEWNLCPSDPLLMACSTLGQPGRRLCKLQSKPRPARFPPLPPAWQGTWGQGLLVCGLRDQERQVQRQGLGAQC